MATCIAGVLLAPFQADGAIIIDSPVTSWTTLGFAPPPPDYFADQQTGQYDSDIVGSSGVPAFYYTFDGGGTPSLTDGTIAFRVRMSGASKTYWENYLWIGFDADRNGSIDLFAGLAKNNTISIYYPGTGLNISPSTTTIGNAFDTVNTSSSNYSFMAVDGTNAPGQTTDVDANGKTDYFVSFSVSFSNIVAALGAKSISINENSPMNFLAATSTQGNSLNQDINGAPEITSANSDSTWVQLGASSNPVSANGEVIPEPATPGLIGLGGLTALFVSRLRRRA